MDVNTSPLHMTKSKDFSAIARFYAPLGFTSMLMAFTHWIINMGLSHAAAPELALAGWALGVSTGALFESPAVMLRSTSLSLIRTPADQNTVFRAGLLATVVLAAIPAALALTPALSWIYTNLLHVRPEIANPAVMAVRILSLMILGSGLRCLFQGVIIRTRLTGYMTLGILLRLLVMSATSATLVILVPRWGTLIGAITFLLGMWTETITAWFGFKRATIERALAPPIAAPPIQTKKMWSFLLPLLATGTIATLVDALLNTGLARADVPTATLPGLSLATSLSLVITAFCMGLHQVVVVHSENTNISPQTIRRFCITAALTCVSILTLIAYTPIAGWIYCQVMSAPTQLAPQAGATLRLLVIYPFLVAWQEYNMGHIVLARKSATLLLGKLINVSIIVGLVWGPGRQLLLPLGSVAGAIALITGLTGENVTLLISRRVIAKNNAKAPLLGDAL